MNLNGHIQEQRRPQLVRVIKANQQSLDAHWPWLRERLLDVKASNEYPQLGSRRMVDRKALAASFGTSGRCRWTPEQVRWKIMQGFHSNSPVELFYVVGDDYGGTSLPLFEDRAVIKGFLISICAVDPMVGVPMDFILWLLWAGYPHLLEDADPHIERLARERGCTAEEHTSPREGWFRRQRNCGEWNLKYFTWRKNLT